MSNSVAVSWTYSAQSYNVMFNQKLEYALFGYIAGTWQGKSTITEGARFTLPHVITLPNLDGGTVEAKYLDMRWEDYSDGIHNLWEQWAPFVAKLPFVVGDEVYLVWDPDNQKRSCYFASFDDLPDFPYAPDKWWEIAHIIDIHGNTVMGPGKKRADQGEMYY